MFQQILKGWFVVSMCVVVLLAGCATAPKMVDVTRLVPMSEADTKVTEKGVTIEVTPIDQTTVGQYPQLSTQVKVKEKTILGVVDTPLTIPNVLMGVTLTLKITNNTGHVLSLAGALINLTIQGQDFPQATKEDIVNAWTAYFMQKYPLQPGVPSEITSKVNGLSFWDESARIPPGRSKEVFVVFNTELKKGLGEAGLSIYDLVTQTDAAGNPTERANFNFTFMEKTESIQVGK
jgi:hypothetical protein